MIITEEFKRSLSLINERKEQFRRLHERASTENEDVMSRYYNISTNQNKPVRIDEITIDRLLNKHGKEGLINISANRSDLSQADNIINTKSLIADLKDSGYSYLPTHGGYRGKDGVEDDYEPSFIVFNKTNGEKRDFEELRQFAILLCGKYNQDSVLIKAPNENPIYIDRNGFCNTHLKDIKTIGKRYVNPMPCTLTERRRRIGEIMVWE